MYRRFRRIPPPIQDGDLSRPSKLPVHTLPNGMHLTQGFLHGSASVYRYAACKPNPALPNVLWSNTELPGENPGLNPLDRAEMLAFDDSGAVATADLEFRSCRANIAFKSGDWYFEVQILNARNPGTDAHVRVGLSRREFALDSPVGSDAFSYGIADKGRKLHLSKPHDFADFKTGDILGFHVHLPVQTQAQSLFRTRIPFEAGGQIWLDYPNYIARKEMHDLQNPKTLAPEAAAAEFIRGSVVHVLKNGVPVGTLAEDLREFLPPFSSLQDAIGTGIDYDDGMLGYFPTISCFGGGKARFNMGPDFAHAPPAECRSAHELWLEQIAEDVYLDLVDQVVFEIHDAMHPDLKPSAMESIPLMLREEKDAREDKDEKWYYDKDHSLDSLMDSHMADSHLGDSHLGDSHLGDGSMQLGMSGQLSDQLDSMSGSLGDGASLGHSTLGSLAERSLEHPLALGTPLNLGNALDANHDLMMSAPFRPTLDHMAAEWDMHLEEQ